MDTNCADAIEQLDPICAQSAEQIGVQGLGFEVYEKCARDIHCDMPLPSVMSPLFTMNLPCVQGSEFV